MSIRPSAYPTREAWAQELAAADSKSTGLQEPLVRVAQGSDHRRVSDLFARQGCAAASVASRSAFAPSPASTSRVRVARRKAVARAPRAVVKRKLKRKLKLRFAQRTLWNDRFATVLAAFIAEGQGESAAAVAAPARVS